MTTLTRPVAAAPTTLVERIVATLPKASELVETTGMLAVAGFMLASINYIL